MTDKVRLAPVGLGRWARVLARGARRGDVIELYSCFSRDEAKRTAFQEEFGIERAATTYEELLADDAVEGVIVTTPNDTHKDVIVQALDAGRRDGGEHGLRSCSGPLGDPRADQHRLAIAGRDRKRATEPTQPAPEVRGVAAARRCDRVAHELDGPVARRHIDPRTAVGVTHVRQAWPHLPG